MFVVPNAIAERHWFRR